ncbi:hypothetical protein DERP_014401 [Dermatophagoides pteronyssinus]|uniref:Uncharacterized protein n=1 Tax=Dermatophagoides pteronyssinus TaxID=6956 RepID=A0ABQ8J5T5_DERPT|nr:hypothetical protein DERP_014401 [Dermatophagoides pteronyssinus]
MLLTQVIRWLEISTRKPDEHRAHTHGLPMTRIKFNHRINEVCFRLIMKLKWKIFLAGNFNQIKSIDDFI